MPRQLVAVCQSRSGQLGGMQMDGSAGIDFYDKADEVTQRALGKRPHAGRGWLMVLAVVIVSFVALTIAGMEGRPRDMAIFWTTLLFGLGIYLHERRAIREWDRSRQRRAAEYCQEASSRDGLAA